MTIKDTARAEIDTPLGRKTIYRLSAIKGSENLPYSVKVLLEAALRNMDGKAITAEQVQAVAAWPESAEFNFMPGRVVLQDFTGVPCVVDLAAMRSAMKRMGGDPRKVNPLVPCDLVIDHSVQVDAFGSKDALRENSRIEFERNRGRYEFLKWGQGAFNNFSIVPPATGIVHQVNLEYLAKVVWERDGVLFPDSVVGTDSHTTMINGLGVLGWGVGGIEAEAVMLGQPIPMLVPEVVGFKLTGKLPEGATATDLVLRVTQMLRAHGVVDKFVEFFGDGLDTMPLATRATIANMAPEYGATCGFFPVDKLTLDYLSLSGRSDELISTIEIYCREQGLWREPSRKVKYSAELSLDLRDITPSLAGPKRPQDRIALTNMKAQWHKDLADSFGVKSVAAAVDKAGMANEGGAASAAHAASTAVALHSESLVPVEIDGREAVITHGSVVIAAITSCTNTSNPGVMLGAGLLAKKAVERGLTRQPWVKTSLAPGSLVVTDYLQKAGVMPALEALGFHVVGYGCTTCIGNSGPLPDVVGNAVRDNNLVAASVLSGNRNFEGRVHADVKANYLASPPLVVAYAIAGTVDIDLATEPLGKGKDGKPVYLRDIWPSQAEIEQTIHDCVTREQFQQRYANVFKGGGEEWQKITPPQGELYVWDKNSTYIQEPSFFDEMKPEPDPIKPIRNARCLLKLADSVTTDHISPAGSIDPKTPAGQYLIKNGVPAEDFNSYGARRGNHKVMMRGTFANKRIRNQLAPGTEGGWTTDYTDSKVKYVFDASVNYRNAGIPLVVLAGKDYGMGSSRDWAAKGTLLLGVKAVLAESFERIHRSNLIGMGVLPLTYLPGEDAKSLGLKGDEVFDIEVNDNVTPRQKLNVRATDKDGRSKTFQVTCALNSSVEIEYYRNGGVLHTVLRRMA
ncbi:MAG: aconitate hydratase AcnA [Planctomycetes bacterium]|nr:aconitate hydratase AcnA [Planctomycetota bacterium]MCW8135049.1 aconitate hydratase AcnA [Planctomycetota bacterium]